MTKKYRLKKETMGLPIGIEAKETAQGYCIRISGTDWIGLPKVFVDDNPEWFERVIERWEPKENETYYVVATNGDIFSEIFRKQFKERVIMELFNYYNVFKTQDQAIEARYRIKETLMKYHEEIRE